MLIHATVQQVIDTYSSLSDDELIALRKAAKCHLSGTKFTEPCDLIHEAIGLLLDGVRHWPMHVDFSRFMFATMRSIAYAERRRHENKLGASRSFEDLIESGELSVLSVDSIECQLIEAEPAKLVLSATHAAREALDGDDLAQYLIDSLLAGLEPKEACADFKMAMPAYRAARKRAITVIKRIASDRLR